MLVNGAEHALTVFALHFNSNGVAKLHELRAGLAIQDGFNGTLFSDAAVTFGPLRLALDVHTLVADGAAAHNRACAHIARFANVCNQLTKVKSHFGACFAHAHLATIPSGLQGEVQTALVPGVAQFIQGDGHRTERCGRFALKEAKTFGQFVGDEIAQANVVGQHHQANAIECVLRCDAHGHIASDDCNFCFEVNAEFFITAQHRIAGPDEIIAATLVHQRVGVKALGHFRAA